MSRIFVSYNNENASVVQTLAADLGTMSHQVWFDKELTGGQAWWDRILAEIRRCDVFVFALSPSSLDSQPCKLEHEYATRLGKPVLPVLIADNISPALLPSSISKVQYVDYRRHDKEAFVSLFRALESLPAAQPPDVLPTPPPVPLSYLSELKDQIDAPALGFEAQTALVVKLKEALRRKSDARDARRLMERLRERRDLFAVVATEIDELFADRKGRPTPKRASVHADPLPNTEPAPVARRPAAPRPSTNDAADEAAELVIEVRNGEDAVVDVLRRVAKMNETWTFSATPHRSVTVRSDGNTIAGLVMFSDLAALIESAGKRLKAAGWQTDFIRTAGQALVGGAIGLSFGTLLLNKTIRDFSVANTMNRSWPLRGGDGHLRQIATEILAALAIIAPNHKTVTARSVT